ncbi:hypothetical protein LTS18_004776, partial [Coniosporium uncinatum]
MSDAPRRSTRSGALCSTNAELVPQTQTFQDVTDMPPSSSRKRRRQEDRGDDALINSTPSRRLRSSVARQPEILQGHENLGTSRFSAIDPYIGGPTQLRPASDGFNTRLYHTADEGSLYGNLYSVTPGGDSNAVGRAAAFDSRSFGYDHSSLGASFARVHQDEHIDSKNSESRSFATQSASSKLAATANQSFTYASNDGTERDRARRDAPTMQAPQPSYGRDSHTSTTRSRPECNIEGHTEGQAMSDAEAPTYANKTLAMRMAIRERGAARPPRASSERQISVSRDLSRTTEDIQPAKNVRPPPSGVPRVRAATQAEMDHHYATADSRNAQNSVFRAAYRVRGYDQTGQAFDNCFPSEVTILTHTVEADGGYKAALLAHDTPNNTVTPLPTGAQVIRLRKCSNCWKLGVLCSHHFPCLTCIRTKKPGCDAVELWDIDSEDEEVSSPSQSDKAALHPRRRTDRSSGSPAKRKVTYGRHVRMRRSFRGFSFDDNNGLTWVASTTLAPAPIKPILSIRQQMRPLMRYIIPKNRASFLVDNAGMPVQRKKATDIWNSTPWDVKYPMNTTLTSVEKMTYLPKTTDYHEGVIPLMYNGWPPQVLVWIFKRARDWPRSSMPHHSRVWRRYQSTSVDLGWVEPKKMQE